MVYLILLTALVSAETVARAAAPAVPPTFERHVLPMLTARGCNGGGCHGKSGGQNGFALSLLGFDGEGDYLALVMQSRGRRISVSAPEESLLIRKGTGEVPHGGGRRLNPDGDDVQTLLAWILGDVDRQRPQTEHEQFAIEPGQDGGDLGVDLRDFTALQDRAVAKHDELQRVIPRQCRRPGGRSHCGAAGLLIVHRKQRLGGKPGADAVTIRTRDGIPRVGRESVDPRERVVIGRLIATDCRRQAWTKDRQGLRIGGEWPQRR